MGYYSGWSSRKELVANLTDSTRYAKGTKVIDKGGSGNEFYVLIERPDGVIMIIQYLLSSYRGEWGYKPIEETAGPAKVDHCPLRMLKKSTCNEGFAMEFRKRCMAARERKSKLRNLLKGMSHGDKVTMANDESVVYRYDFSPVYFVGTGSDGENYRFRKADIKLEETVN